MSDTLLLPLVSKQGVAVLKLAQMLLSHQKGDRLEPIQYYAETYNTGVGTIQAAVAYLQEIEAIRLDTRGHLGTFILDINYPMVWSLTRQNHIVGGMPLPYSRRLEGLATGLHEAFEQVGIALNMVYMRGSLNRLQNLDQEKFDFAILSRFAFNNALQRGSAIEEVLSLGVGSYVSQHILLLAKADKQEIEDGMRVGIDPSSLDQVLLTKAACQDKRVEYVEINYMNLMTAMTKGQIDATTWVEDDFYASSLPFRAVPLSPSQQAATSQENTEAVIAAGLNNNLVIHTLRSIVNTELVCSIQQQVMSGQLLPIY
jgi:hypothetical protein